MATSGHWLWHNVIEEYVLIQCDVQVRWSPGETVVAFDRHVHQPGVARGDLPLVNADLCNKPFALVHCHHM